MSAKIHCMGDTDTGPHGGKMYSFLCPGCGYRHRLEVSPHAWSWNGSLEEPTFRPSFVIAKGTDQQCQGVITDGRIQFFDCFHYLARHAVALPDWEPYAELIYS